MRKNVMKDLYPQEWKMLSIGQPHVGSIVITDSPQKAIYKRVQWFDVRKMTLLEANQLAKGLSCLGDFVYFDCFSQVTVVVSVVALSAWHER